eukprot:CAMPEP_0181171034 /NCGR_PEP_ID=MMETSP1096-20121128/1687_1 /TAXON_ID=156174 ORGANISM="Chrysochromulina ericina, Strain CCMP281" /NCGR_SAMPLE_ID=MMETSP1096 /ASSEMBLY_ACC=CAM_ASM_000453 /LENGTH=56 /DNA_ID=CAMNT_0023258641 /DNA_START=228 /DNA_END=396 /DNA_ORIENTATION=-
MTAASSVLVPEAAQLHADLARRWAAAMLAHNPVQAGGAAFNVKAVDFHARAKPPVW